MVNKMAVCKYRSVSERDMDLLFMEAFATDHEFSKLFLDKTAFVEKEYTVIQAERSKIDNGLGESDLTVIYEINGLKHALLIEDKIDAIAMPDQHGRYFQRGEKGRENCEYHSYDVFIVCPEKYRNNNDEAQKYSHFVSYEECRDYFNLHSDLHNQHRYQQICQAIETMKAEYKLDINETAVDSFKKYLEYQRMYYKRLECLTTADRKTVNGWWPFFSCFINDKKIYIIHKTNFNCVDLTINGAADRLPELKFVEEWLHKCGKEHIHLLQTGKSAAFRIDTPKITMSEPFSEWKEGDLKACFEAVEELMDLALMFFSIDKGVFGY